MAIDVYQITVDSLTRQLNRLDHTSNNVANINTPGYLSHDSFSTIVDGKVVEKTSFNVGNIGISQTNRPLDIAINGNGFFLLSLGDKAVVSKSGRFHINQEGQLSHSSGALIQGENGTINAIAGNTSFDTNGNVLVSGEVVDQIKVLSIENAHSLSPLGNNLFNVPSEGINISSQSLTVGALNRSTVVASEEMIRMMELSRSIQSSQKIIQAYDQLMNVGVNELGKK